VLPTGTEPSIDPYYAQALNAQLSASSDEKKQKIQKQMMNHMAGHTVFPVDEDTETTTMSMEEQDTTVASDNIATTPAPVDTTYAAVVEEAMDNFLNNLMATTKEVATTEGTATTEETVTSEGATEDPFYAQALQAQLAAGEDQVKLDIQKLTLNHMASSNVFPVGFELKDVLPTGTEPSIDPYYAQALNAQLVASSDEEKLTIQKQMMNHMAGHTVFPVDKDTETTTMSMEEQDTTTASVDAANTPTPADIESIAASVIDESAEDVTVGEGATLESEIVEVITERVPEDPFYEAALIAQLEAKSFAEKLNIMKYMLNYMSKSEVHPVDKTFLPPALLLF